MVKSFRKRVIQASAVAALIAIALQVNSIAVLTLVFSLNQHAIELADCERQTPDCHGQCFLKKQMKAATEESSPASPTGERMSHLLSISSEYLQSHSDVPELLSAESNFFSNINTDLTSGATFSVFNPPKAVLA